MFAILVLFVLLLRNMALTGRVDRELSAVLEGIAWEDFRVAGLPDRFRDKVAVVIPAYNEEDNIGAVLPRIPAPCAASRPPCWSWTTGRATAPATSRAPTEPPSRAT